VQKAAASLLQVPLHSLSERWTVVALDLPALLRGDGRRPYAALKGLQFCANLRVRGAYTSDHKCAPRTRPGGRAASG